MHYKYYSVDDVLNDVINSSNGINYEVFPGDNGEITVMFLVGERRPSFQIQSDFNIDPEYAVHTWDEAGDSESEFISIDVALERVSAL